jgi:hypothetical protein
MRHLRSFADNQRYGINVSQIITWKNVVPSDKEIGITTRTFAADLGPVINTVPGQSPARGRTKPTDAIVNINSQSFLKFKQSFRRERGIIRRDKTTTNISQKPLNTVNSLGKRIDIRGAAKALRTQVGALPRELGTELKRRASSNFAQNVDVAYRSPGWGREGGKIVDGVGHLSAFRVAQGFLNNNDADLLASPSRVQIGGVIYLSAYTYPLTRGSQQLKLSLYLKDVNGKTKELGTTGLRDSVSARRIALSTSTVDMAPGEAHAIFVVFNENDQIVYVNTQPVFLYDAGAILGVPDASVASSGLARDTQDISSNLILREGDESLLVPTGPDRRHIRLLITARDGVTANRKRLGCQSIDAKDWRRKQHISIWEADAFVVIEGTTGTLYEGTKVTESVTNQIGDDYNVPTPKHAAVVYKEIDTSLIPGGETNNLIAIISDVDGGNKNSLLKIDIGPDYELGALSATSVDNGDGTWTLTITTPYVETICVAFLSGGNNMIPLDVTTTSFTTTTAGAGSVTLTIPPRAWVGLAFAQPVTATLSSRTFLYTQMV